MIKLIPLITCSISMSLLLPEIAFSIPLDAALAFGPVTSSADFMAIPGATRPGTMSTFIWGIWVGFVFSTVGAFGGIMAGVGLISIFGLGDYAAAFQKSSPTISNSITDGVRASNQALVGFSALISSIYYYRMDRLVYPIGAYLAGGGIAASLMIPLLTVGRIDPSTYLGYFGLCVLFVGAFLLYETTPTGRKKRALAKEAADAFERDHIQRVRQNLRPGHEVSIISSNWDQIEFSFYGVQFAFKPVFAFIGGFFIAAISTFLGVGGGFLYVPFLTTIIGLPMFIVAGTSAMGVLISMCSAVISYIWLMDVQVDFQFIFVQTVGILVGSILGPWASRYTPEIWLERMFVVLSLYFGIGYTVRGFLGYSILPGI